MLSATQQNAYMTGKMITRTITNNTGSTKKSVGRDHDYGGDCRAVCNERNTVLDALVFFILFPGITSIGEDGERARQAAERQAGDREPISVPEVVDDGEPVTMSLDRDASDRTLDRQLAYLGLLDDAAPLFREGSSVPSVGVLSALPCLVESGLFRISRKLYGDIGPAFYGQRTKSLRSSPLPRERKRRGSNKPRG
jgi:hypothetical protein